MGWSNGWPTNRGYSNYNPETAVPDSVTAEPHKADSRHARGWAMDEKTTVVAICGSRRENSVTRIALHECLSGAREHAAETVLIDLRDRRIPPFDPDVDTPPSVREMAFQVRKADAIILGTPMYHGSYSGVLKNAIDYCGFEEFENTTVGLVGVAGGRFPITALEHLRSICRSLNAWVLPTQAAIPESHSVVEEGHIRDDELTERLRTVGRRVVEYANIEPDPPCFESQENVGA